MALTLFQFFGSAVLICLSCKFFVNGVEWVGARLNVSQTATGTILAAFGTALPESVVTFVAIAFGTSPTEREIGVGAAMGGPLALSTLAYGIVGLTLMGSERLRIRRKDALEVDYRRLSRDQGWFLIIFIGKLALGLVAFPGKPWLGFLFLGLCALRLEGTRPPGERGGCAAARAFEDPADGFAARAVLGARANGGGARRHLCRVAHLRQPT
jgi:cation:H+ antiporter